MRLSCVFKTEKIPVGYSMLFVSLLKYVIQKVDSEYYKKIYEYQGNKTNKKSKNFCWSIYMNKFKKQEEEFLIEGDITFNISSPDYEFIVNVYNGLLTVDTYKYKNYMLEKVIIKMVKEREIYQNKVAFKTLSPIFIKGKDGKSIEITDENYEKEFNYLANIIVKNYRGYGLKKEINIASLSNIKKTVVKQEIQAFSKKTQKKYYYVNAYHGNFELEGDKEDLLDIYQLGISFKRNQGFGMLTII